MATLILICGLPGAGKTTLARQLEHDMPALRLSPDEWIAHILDDPTNRRNWTGSARPVETVQWDVAMRVLALGVDVVIEWGFWSREERKCSVSEHRRLVRAWSYASWMFALMNCGRVWSDVMPLCLRERLS